MSPVHLCSCVIVLSSLFTASLPAATPAQGQATESSRSAAQVAARAVLNVRDCGAKGDGATLDTAALQKAIDGVAAQGGGIVRVPAGNYLTGTIHLKTRVQLQIDKGAALLGSPREEDYPAVGEFRDGLGKVCNRVLVSAREVKEVAVTGEGTIDGQVELQKGFKIRPFLVRFHECKGVRLEGVTLTRSPMWTCHIWDSSDIAVQGVTIRNDLHGRNNDGFDIDASSDVTIRGCHITCGDDAICFKATVNKPCRRVTVSNCTFITPWNGFKIGTESAGDFEEITMTDCVFEQNTKGGIRIYSMDGANIRGIRVENITMQSVSLPVYIRLGARLKVFTKGGEPRPVGTISDVVLRNIHGKTHGTGVVFITGIPEHPVRNVRIENLDCSTPGGDDGKNLETPLAERESAYPEPYTIYGPLPAYGVMLRHVEGCKITKLRVKCDKPDMRHAVACQDVKEVCLEGPIFENAAPNPAPELSVSGSPADAIKYSGWQPKHK